VPLPWQTGCFLGWKVVRERIQQAIQERVDEASKAKHYHSEAHLFYP